MKLNMPKCEGTQRSERVHKMKHAVNNNCRMVERILWRSWGRRRKKTAHKGSTPKAGDELNTFLSMFCRHDFRECSVVLSPRLVFPSSRVGLSLAFGTAIGRARGKDCSRRGSVDSTVCHCWHVAAAGIMCCCNSQLRRGWMPQKMCFCIWRSGIDMVRRKRLNKPILIPGQRGYRWAVDS